MNEHTTRQNGQTSYTHSIDHSKRLELKSTDPFSEISSSTLMNTLPKTRMHLTRSGTLSKISLKKNKTKKTHQKIHHNQSNNGWTESRKNLTRNSTKQSEKTSKQITDTHSHRHSRKMAMISTQPG